MKEYRKAKPLSRAKIRQQAADIREALFLGKEQKVNIVGLLEQILPLIDPEFEEPLIVDDNEMEVDAVTCPEDHMIIVKQSVYDGARAGNGRDRFTLAHEFAHYLMHDSSSVSFARGNSRPQVFEDPEWQADVFAGEFLMPAEAIKSMTPEEVMITYGVSYSAARYQLNKIKKTG